MRHTPGSSSLLKTRQKGFSLLELVVVVIIIGVLTTLAIPKMLQTILQAKVVEARSTLSLIRKNVVAYRLMHGTDPLGSDPGPWSDFGMLAMDNPNDAPGASFRYYIRAASFNCAGVLLKASHDDLRLMAYYPRDIPLSAHGIAYDAEVLVALRENGTISAYRIGKGTAGKWYGPIN